MLSIITVVYNDRIGLMKTINSIIQQRAYSKDFEFIIIDGDSSDGTKDIISEYSYIITKYISKKDNGIYDAMNKGMSLADGSELLFLNAGDCFVGNVLGHVNVAPSFIRVRYKDILGIIREVPIRKKMCALPNCHQGIIFQNNNIKYDEKFEICADYKFYLDQKINTKVPFVEGDGYILFDSNGISSRKIAERDKEAFEIRREYFGYCVAVLTEIKPMMKRIVRLMLRKNR